MVFYDLDFDYIIRCYTAYILNFNSIHNIYWYID